MLGKIQAKVIADSINAQLGTRITTMSLVYHRYIHSEFMTHRVFSRNASSSRAVPIAKQIDLVEQNPMFPVEWGQNKPGMQAGEPLSRADQTLAEGVWAKALQDAVARARELKDLGVHKQIVNRILEPFSSISVIVTATEWNNFFDLRISPLAQPEIRVLAEKMREAMNKSNPLILLPHEMHLPFITDEERCRHPAFELAKISAARCARVSYLNHDGLPPDVNKDMALAERLAADRHASVFEHQALPMQAPSMCRNLRDWYQFRAVLGL